MSTGGEARRGILLCALVGVSLLPFLAKPIHMDDPMFVWTARQITAHPLDFYGFDVNWYGASMPMFELNKNPPLVSYWLAGVGSLLGFGEVALHAGMMLPALAFALGTWSLARRLCASPLLAAAVAWLTPVAVVSSTTLMSDVLMLALWVWAIELWLRGLAAQSGWQLLAAALLMGLCPLAKYFGLALLPLIAAYTLARERRVGRWALFLLVPVFIVAAYQAFMLWRYGWNPLGDIGAYAIAGQGLDQFTLFGRGLVALAFAGGGLLTTLFFAPWLWSRRALALGAGATVLGIAAIPLLLATVGSSYPFLADAVARWRVGLHLLLFAVAGGHILWLAALDLRRSRSADALLLALWVGGVWFFCGFTNWTPTSRAILPMAPAAGILIARALEARRGGRSLDADVGLAAPLALGLLLSLVVAWGDTELARAERDAARELHARYAPEGARLWFQGGWGFQYYMEQQGAARLDVTGPPLRRGDVVVTPLAGSNIIELGEPRAQTLVHAHFAATSWLALMSGDAGAGFYAALYGPVPYAFGPNPPSRYRVERLEQPLRLLMPAR